MQEMCAGAVADKDISQKFISRLHLMKSHSSIAIVSIAQSFWNFAQSTAVSLPCSVQNFKMIRQLSKKSLANKIWDQDEFNRDIQPVYYNSPPNFQNM